MYFIIFVKSYFPFVVAHWKKQIEFQRDWLMTNPWRNNTDCEMKESERERNAVKNQKSGQTLKSLEFDWMTRKTLFIQIYNYFLLQKFHVTRISVLYLHFHVQICLNIFLILPDFSYHLYLLFLFLFFTIFLTDFTKWKIYELSTFKIIWFILLKTSFAVILVVIIIL